jgi:hypothetical protein
MEGKTKTFCTVVNEAIGSSKTLISVNETAWTQIPEDETLNNNKFTAIKSAVSISEVFNRIK